MESLDILPGIARAPSRSKLAAVEADLKQQIAPWLHLKEGRTIGGTNHPKPENPKPKQLMEWSGNSATLALSRNGDRGPSATPHLNTDPREVAQEEGQRTP